MIGLVIASHGHLAAELVATAEQLVGKLESVASCTVEPGASLEEIRASIRDAVKEVDAGQGVVLFADLIGGSPCTQSLSLCQQANLEVVTGVNLPMLLKASSLRKDIASISELAQSITVYGQKNITCATALYREHQRRP